MFTLYQKSTCVSCKKALAWLQAQGCVDRVRVLDIEKEPPLEAAVRDAIARFGAQACLNARSAVYKAKGLAKGLPDTATLLAWIREDPNLIKRPLLVGARNEVLAMGYDEAALVTLFDEG